MSTSTTKKLPTGIRVKHGRRCPAAAGDRCSCRPVVYEAWAWDRRAQKKIYGRFTSLQEARGFRADTTGAIRRGTLTAPSRQTLREAADDWLAKAESGEILSKHRRPYKPSATRGYRGDLKNHVLPDLGGRRLSDVTADDLQDLIGRLTAAGLSGSKVRNVIVAVQAVYRYHRRHVTVNPTRDLDLPEPAGTREWSGTPEDAKAHIDALPEDERGLWATAWYAGLRRGELRALRVSNVHGLEDDAGGEGWIEVEHGWDDREGEIDPKSTAGVRVVPLPKTLRCILLEHVERTSRAGHDLLFGKTGTDPFVPWTVGDRADRAWSTAKLERLTLHQARHGYKSFLEDAGISEARCDRYMGHSSTKVGRRYNHRIAGQLEADANQLDAYLVGEAASVVVLRPWAKATGAKTGAQSV